MGGWRRAINYNAESASGNGWSWDGTSTTLTLSGVNAGKSGYDAIYIAGDATVVLEGANSATAVTGKSGLYCHGTLTIKGSGTLEVTSEAENCNGVFSAGAMTIESGYITADSTMVFLSVIH